jgi:hypothetical protein
LFVNSLSSIKLEIRAEQFLPGSEGVRGRERRGGEMTQILYAHMNKQQHTKKKNM